MKLFAPETTSQRIAIIEIAKDPLDLAILGFLDYFVVSFSMNLAWGLSNLKSIYIRIVNLSYIFIVWLPIVNYKHSPCWLYGLNRPDKFDELAIK